MTMTSKTEITEEQVKDNLETGIVMAIEEKRTELMNDLESLSKKELKRVLENAARFPSPRIPTGGFSKFEAKATETLYAIKDLQVELSICTIGRAQEEQNNSETQENDNE